MLTYLFALYHACDVIGIVLKASPATSLGKAVLPLSALPTRSAPLATPASGWRMINFTITASGSTSCKDYSVGKDYPGSTCHANAENECPVCSGQVAYTLVQPAASQSSATNRPADTNVSTSAGAAGAAGAASAAGAVMLDQIYLGPGQWNRFQNLPCRLDVVNNLKRMGLQVLRNGGSQCNSDEYRWKRFRGPAWVREPFDGTWYKKYASPGWRIFEFLNMCTYSCCIIILEPRRR